MSTLKEYLDRQMNQKLRVAVLSGSRTSDIPDKIRIRPVEQKGRICFQAEYMEGARAFHKNYEKEALLDYLEMALTKQYRQFQAQGLDLDGTVLVSKKGKVTIKSKSHISEKPVQMLSHNRVKHYILKEGTPIPFLVDLGVMTREGKVVSKRYDKFRQINRFLEFVEDILPKLPRDREITILDFGCGKSYLTFAMYYYLRELQKLDVRMIGLDLKEDVIRHCQELAERYGYEKLTFLQGDVADYQGEGTVDMVVTLHACDTATDYALARAAAWGAEVILSVPCCQHEINRQIKNDLLAPILKYGILKERMSALITDGLRAELLESAGYDTQILEFIDMEHTPKNLLIRAVRRRNNKAGKRPEELMKALHVTLTLETLLSENKQRVEKGD